MKAPLHQAACFALEGVFLRARMRWRISHRIAAAARGVALMFGMALAAGSALAPCASSSARPLTSTPSATITSARPSPVTSAISASDAMPPVAVRCAGRNVPARAGS
jgi:hypothetical protein